MYIIYSRLVCSQIKHQKGSFSENQLVGKHCKLRTGANLLLHNSDMIHALVLCGTYALCVQLLLLLRINTISSFLMHCSASLVLAPTMNGCVCCTLAFPLRSIIPWCNCVHYQRDTFIYYCLTNRRYADKHLALST